MRRCHARFGRWLLSARKFRHHLTAPRRPGHDLPCGHVTFRNWYHTTLFNGTVGYAGGTVSLTLPKVVQL